MRLDFSGPAWRAAQGRREGDGRRAARRKAGVPPARARDGRPADPGADPPPAASAARLPPGTAPATSGPGGRAAARSIRAGRPAHDPFASGRAGAPAGAPHGTLGPSRHRGRHRGRAGPGRGEPADGSDRVPDARRPAPHFGFEDVLKRAREIGTAPFEANPPPLPDALARLDFDSWRDIRFRRDRALLGRRAARSAWRCSISATLHPARDGQRHPRRHRDAGALCGEPVRLRPQQDRQAAAAEPRLRGLPAALPAEPTRACSTRWRPSSARAISACSAAASATASRPAGSRSGPARRREEFPFFREFWVEAPGPLAERVTIYALLDGAVRHGRLPLRPLPGAETVMEVSATLFPRRADFEARPRAADLDVLHRARTTAASPTISAPNCTIPTGC